MPGEKDSSFKRAVDSMALQRISRVAIVTASLCLPLAFWGIERIIDKADTAVSVMADLGRKIDLLEQLVRLTGAERAQQIVDINGKLTDQETRLRALERADAGLGRSRP